MLTIWDLSIAFWLLGCPLLGALIGPRKGVDPLQAAVSCLVTGYLGVIYLATRPDAPPAYLDDGYFEDPPDRQAPIVRKTVVRRRSRRTPTGPD